jgi:glycosyltransferase involved in cell wall biosynthesis
MKTERLKILHITSAGFDSGAGMAAVLTHKGLCEINGIDSKILMLESNNEDKSRFINYSSISLANKLKRPVITGLEKLPLVLYSKRRPSIFSTGFFGVTLSQIEAFKWADVIHLHWVNHGFVDIKDIKSWNKPVVWTLRDMWVFTGGCHHTFGCNKYLERCGSCPNLRSKSAFDLSTLVQHRKKTILNNTKITWVAVSKWIEKEARRSTVLRDEEIHIIYSGINTDIFHHTDKIESRLKLNIPVNAKIILVGATKLSDEYKGFEYIQYILNKVSSDIIVVSFGNKSNYKWDIHQKVIDMGYVTNQDELALLYSAADIFFSPSTMEAFGKTIAEAQSCGTPVVCFKNTGPEDIVEHLKTGYVAQHQDEEDLLRGLIYCLTTIFNTDYIRNRCISKFDIKITVRRYADIYKYLFRDSNITSEIIRN